MKLIQTTKWSNDKMVKRQNGQTTKWSNDKMVKRQNGFCFGFVFGCVFVSFNFWPKTKKKPRPSEQHRLYVIITHKDGFSLFNSHFLVKLTNHSRGIMTFCKQKFVRLFFYKKEFNHLII
jgi:hypothetical protein